MKNLRKYAGKTAPNPKEFGYWVDLSSDPHGKIIKTYDGESWLVIQVSSSGGSEDSTIEFYVKCYYGDLTLQAEKGMSWQEWCASEYNTHGFETEGGDYFIYTYTHDNGGWDRYSEWLRDPVSYYSVAGKDIIQEGFMYDVFVDSGIGGGL